MPELPEVETIRADLEGCLLNKKIAKADVLKGKIVRGSTAVFKRLLTGGSFRKIERRGKLLIFDIAGTDIFLLVHLKMTGQLVYQEGKRITSGGHSWPLMNMKLPNKHTHIIITFTDKSKLFFSDLRQFGFMQIVSTRQKDLVIAKYGIEPLTRDFSREKFRRVFKSRRAPLKAVLLNQNLIAGLGNIYADEICFSAGVRPGRRADRLTAAEVDKLYRATQAVIKKAIKYRGTTFSDYVDGSGSAGNFVAHLKVYGRTGKICLRCKQGFIKKIKKVGRGTHYCPACQK
jgi:formamidopyrimidine-DNA glycosylase